MKFLVVNYLIFLTSIVLLFSSPLAFAASFPDITGTYTGSASGTDSGCISPADDVPFTDTVTAVLSNQSGGSFSVTLTHPEEGGGVFTATGSGSFTSSTTLSMSVSGSAPGPSTDSLTINATIGSSLTFTLTGSNSGAPGDGCSFSGSGTVSLGGAGVVAVTEATPGSTLTTITTTTTLVQGVTSSLNNRIGGAIHGLGSRQQFTPTTTGVDYEGGISGLNAGDSAISYGAWVSYSYSDFENDFSATAIEGSSHSVLAGVDFLPWESAVLGLAAGYDVSDTDTLFNNGNVESDTYTIAPYFGALLTDTFSVDFSFGYSLVDHNQFRKLTGSTTRITSRPSADMWFGAFNVNGLTFYNNWIIGGRIGNLWAKSELEGFTESDGTAVAKLRTRLGTFSVAADVAYSFKEFEPFLSATYSHDYNLTEIVTSGTGPQPANDRDDVLLLTGMRYFGNNGITGNFEYSKRLDREDFSEDRYSLTVRVDF